MIYKYFTRQVISELYLRKPDSTDGFAVHQLIAANPPLDTNSVYCNLLQCSHFANTCVLAEQNATLVGFTSAYLLPGDPSQLFVWQTAVSKSARGQGLASAMLEHLLSRPECAQVRYISCSITAENQGSWALFKRLARQLNADIQDQVMFDRDQHFQGQHDSERLVTIGPISAGSVQRLQDS